MKRLLVLFSLALFAVCPVQAAPLTSEELARATAHLQKTSAAFLASTEGLSEE